MAGSMPAPVAPAAPVRRLLVRAILLSLPSMRPVLTLVTVLSSKMTGDGPPESIGPKPMDAPDTLLWFHFTVVEPLEWDVMRKAICRLSLGDCRRPG